jgi:putative (di)nucleoside polyphosphate hydrolase
MSNLPYRPNVCMLIFNREGKLFLGERAGAKGVWQFPQGGVEAGHSIEESVYREIEEELGVSRDLVRIRKKLDATHEYDFDVIPEYARDRFRGQSQTFWLVEFLGKDTDIQVHSDAAEFQSWMWCSPDEVRKKAELKRQKGYTAPLAEFERFLLSPQN